MNKPLIKRIDWFITLVPFLSILALCGVFMADPEGSTTVLGNIRSFLGEEFGSYYLIIGLVIFFLTIYMVISTSSSHGINPPWRTAPRSVPASSI